MTLAEERAEKLFEDFEQFDNDGEGYLTRVAYLQLLKGSSERKHNRVEQPPRRRRGTPAVGVALEYGRRGLRRSTDRTEL
ncbi:hypothetical protein ACIHFD_47295 [Nonomuraea sp. NPDC051941]|uniref:hypothetical protein n=1 Tax=Nonomuraea sp. NPDC051941 TaxID=3364373 RepID=UPI0037C5A862